MFCGPSSMVRALITLGHREWPMTSARANGRLQHLSRLKIFVSTLSWDKLEVHWLMPTMTAPGISKPLYLTKIALKCLLK